MQHTFVLFFVLASLPLSIFSQKNAAAATANLAGKTWRYQRMEHVESGKTIHRADENYVYTISFQPDSTLTEATNGKTSSQKWVATEDGKTLFFRFRSAEKFRVVSLTDEELTLECQPSNVRGAMRYVFASSKNGMPTAASAIPVKNQAENIQTETKKRFSAGFAGQVGASFGGQSFFLNIGGPNLKFGFGRFSLGVCMVPSVRLRTESDIPQGKTMVSGILGFAPTLGYGRFSIIMPCYTSSPNRTRIT